MKKSIWDKILKVVIAVTLYYRKRIRVIRVIRA